MKRVRYAIAIALATTAVLGVPVMFAGEPLPDCNCDRCVRWNTHCGIGGCCPPPEEGH
jgi:hypothetical protein